MAGTKTIIEQAYSAFNQRDIDGALALMAQDISWPKASEGGKITGKGEIRAYWTRQWSEFDPHAEPLAMTDEDAGKIRVRIQTADHTLTNKSSRRTRRDMIIPLFSVSPNSREWSPATTDLGGSQGEGVSVPTPYPMAFSANVLGAGMV